MKLLRYNLKVVQLFNFVFVFLVKQLSTIHFDSLFCKNVAYIREGEVFVFVF